MLLDFITAQIGAVEDDRRMPPAKARRNRQMNPRRVGDAQIVNSQRGGMGHDRTPLAPQCPADEVIMFALWEVGELVEAVEAAIDARPVAAAGLKVLGLVAVTVFESLRRREIATLECGSTPQSRPRRVSS
ncbi:hypothetical protein [Nonomuraea sp. B5E05]|uniref:hypothetical protein n=1 Tax=Nonomuraea sp. B5E05 TaxID=3153569 RepID=UPI003261A180